MSNPICLSPLRFYDNLLKQNHRKSYAFGHISPLVMPLGIIDPFQFVMPDDVDISEIYLFKALSDKKAIDFNLYDAFIENGLYYKTVNNFKVAIFPGMFPFTSIKYEGEYYLGVKTTEKSITVNTTEKSILYWGTVKTPQWLMLCLRGLPGTEISKMGLKVTTEDGTVFDCPRATPDNMSYFNGEYPCSAGIFYNPFNTDSEYNHGPVIKVEATTYDIDVVKMESWSSANLVDPTDSIPYIHIDAKGPDKVYNTETVKTGPFQFYSEVFCFTSSLNDYLEIEYWNPESNFLIKNGVITFEDNFHFKLRLKSELGKPEYNFEEEATKRLGYSFIESQVSTKVYKFNAILPEYLCDALRIVRLCSNKKITSKNEKYDMLTFDMSVDWQEQGDLASVDCEFQVDNILVNFGGYASKLVIGDYNNDYNNDYKTL